MIELHITQTSRWAGDRHYRTFHYQQKTFTDLNDAKTWLRLNYAHYSRKPMYQDRHNGLVYQCGYVFGWKVGKDHANDRTQYRQDWVQFREVTILDIGRK